MTTRPAYFYETFDRANTWTGTHITTESLISASATHFSRIYAISSTGCYRRIEGESEWEYSPFPSSSGIPAIVVADPADPMTVYVGGYQNLPDRYKDIMLWKSTDGGVSWTTKSSGLQYRDAFIFSMAVSPSSGSIFLVTRDSTVSTQSGVVIRSADGGETWQDISTRLEPGLNVAFLCAGAGNGVVYIGGTHFYRSTDDGETWVRTTTNLAARTIGVDPQDSNRLCVGGSSNVFISSDGGQSWFARYGVVRGVCYNVEIFPADPDTIFVCTETGLYRTLTAGDLWRAAHRGIRSSTIVSVAVAPSEPTRIYLARNRGGTMTTDDSGRIWTETGIFPGYDNTNDLWVDPEDPGVVVAATLRSDTARTTDTGLTWTTAPTGLAAGMILAASPSNPQRLYLGGSHGDEMIEAEAMGVARSNDSGISWSNARRLGVGRGISRGLAVAHHAGNDVLYIVGEDANQPRVFRSMDSGDTWTNVTSNLAVNASSASVRSAWVNPEDVNHALVGAASQTFVTHNGGQSWQTNALGINATDFAWEPTQELLYATTPNGVFRSANRGQSWIDISNNIGMRNVLTANIDHENLMLLVGTDGGGIWRIGIWPLSARSGWQAYE